MTRWRTTTARTNRSSRAGRDVVPFDDAEPIARQRASDERRRATIDQWLRDLRSRADVSINPPLTTNQ